VLQGALDAVSSGLGEFVGAVGTLEGLFVGASVGSSSQASR
jgi:hypothetical protein